MIIQYNLRQTNYQATTPAIQYQAQGNSGMVQAVPYAFWHLKGGFGRHSLNNRGYSQ